MLIVVLILDFNSPILHKREDEDEDDDEEE
jgi:hypothetical protein